MAGFLAVLGFAHLPRLHEHQSERPTGIGSAVAIPAAYRILEQGEAFEVFPTKVRETKIRR
jgi:hypothetical protein